MNETTEFTGVTEDPAMEHFADLLPGKRAPVNRDAAESTELGAEGWDEKPIKYMFKGGEREFFTISHLAAALGKSVVTIRSWEQKGVMPPTPYRSPRPRGGMLPGKPTKGKRLWTREQIKGILEIAESEGVILNGKPPTKHFAQTVLEFYRTLLAKDNDQ
jgi:hypothetical protein